LDGDVRITLPEWLGHATPVLSVDRERRIATLYLDGLPAKSYPIGDDVTLDDLAGLGLRKADRYELKAIEGLQIEEGTDPVHGDSDDDGIPDPVDVLIGAHKTALNGAEYGEGYMKIDYPNGDVPREGGVCTDVIVRAMRNAGVDLQVEIHKDMKKHPDRYG